MEELLNKYHSLIKSKYSKEFNLIISLLRGEFTEIKIEKEFNWKEFLKLTAWHKIYPIFFQKKNRKIEIFPPAIKKQLKEEYISLSEKNLHLTANLLDLDDLFNLHHIQRIWLKGPLLSTDLYQQLNYRLSIDLDIFISIEDLFKTHQLLVSNEFDCEIDIEKCNSVEKYLLFRFRNQLYYYNVKKQLAIELHWRLFNPNGLWNINLEELLENSKEVEIGTKLFKTLNFDYQFIYLATHGARHGWYRLSWLKDIDELIINRNPDWERILSIATRNKLEDIIMQTIILSNLIFNTSIPDCFKDQIISCNAGFLVKKAIDRINMSQEEIKSKGFEHFKSVYYLSRLKNTFEYRFNTYAKLFINLEEIKKLNLPAFLFPLYFLIRPFSWFYEQYIKKF